jgi:hypothetical protein
LALLEQWSEYFGGVLARTIDGAGNMFQRAADGTLTVIRGQTWTWDASSAWARFWGIIDVSGFGTEAWDSADADLWEGDGACYGLRGFASYDAVALSTLVTERPGWVPLGITGEWLILSRDGTIPVPDATWVTWGANVAGAQVPSRDNAYRYISLNPPLNNIYIGDPDSFPETFVDLDGGTITSDADSFSATLMMPDGSLYAGDPDPFPLQFDLIDDGTPVIGTDTPQEIWS